MDKNDDLILKKLNKTEKRLDELEKKFQKNNETISTDEQDPLLTQPIKLISDLDFASASLLQRKFGIGFARAARMHDQLEAMGYIGPAIGSKPREIIKQPKVNKQNESVLSLLSESYSDGIIPYKWLLKMYDLAKLDYKLPIILGINEMGKAQFMDLCKAPHIIIGGATDSGKTTILYSLISTLLYHKKPEELRFILVDPKRVEMKPIFQNLPHLLTEIITEVEKAISALKWTNAEMEQRYKKLSEAGVRNIEEYNKIKGVEKLPYIVFIVDELADLMIFAPDDVEDLIIRLAQLSRAVGIHLLLSTQRPTKDILTGMMRVNIPTRIAFYCASAGDSKVLLDMSGAEKLRREGEVLFFSLDTEKPIRIQTPLITKDEIGAIVQYITEQ